MLRLFIRVGQKFMQRRIQQTNGHRQPLHLTKDAFEVPFLHWQNLVECVLAASEFGSQNHLSHRFDMNEKIDKARQQFLEELGRATNEAELEQLRITFLSRSGLIAQLFEELRGVPPEEKPVVGKLLFRKILLASSCRLESPFLRGMD